MAASSLLLLAAASLLGGAAAAAGGDPEQVHLALTSDPSAVSVTWIAPTEKKAGAVRYWQTDPAKARLTDAVAHSYSAGGETRWVFNAVMEGLLPDVRTSYVVLQDGAQSEELTFRAPPTAARPVKLIAFGDMGTGDYKDHFGPGGALFNDAYVTSLLGGAEEPDLILHVGDVAYDRGNETVWDVFFRNIEPYARHVPYLTCVGNEDHWYNYAGYSQRFFLPSQPLGTASAPHYYSVDYSYVHLVSISTEAKLEPYEPGSRQYAWLEEDLRRANANRKRTPWIVVLGHRPLYCSSTDFYDCDLWGPRTRGILEPLFRAHGVDLYLSGHVHSYERTYPVFNGSKLSSHYDAPNATTHLMVGMGGAGCTGRWRGQPEWSALRVGHYGVGALEVDRTSLRFSLVETEGVAHVADSIVISKPDAAAAEKEVVV